MSSVERHGIGRNEWVAMDGLPGFRAGCAGFFVGDGEEREFWVMGGYGESRIISGVFPMDEHYRDAVVMELKNGNGGCMWREVGDMWEAEERMRLGKTAVVEDGDELGLGRFDFLFFFLLLLLLPLPSSSSGFFFLLLPSSDEVQFGFFFLI
ncbi:hypothetical protein ACFX12_009166 [Malus domestica]